jgi:hypothetical protein
VTESGSGSGAEWIGILETLSRTSGHELRNALNGLVVNLEAVRSLTAGTPAQHFAEQAVGQSEESVRVAESAIALLNLLVGAIGPDGVVRCSLESPGTVRIAASEGESHRAARAMKGLAARGVVTADASDSAVILSISDNTA